VVREAIARLKADGLIETRQGSGAFVVEAPKAINLRFWKGAGPELSELRDIFELRVMVESAVAALAAQRRKAADLKAMAGHLAAMDEAIQSGATAPRLTTTFTSPWPAPRTTPTSAGSSNSSADISPIRANWPGTACVASWPIPRRPSASTGTVRGDHARRCRGRAPLRPGAPARHRRPPGDQAGPRPDPRPRQAARRR
jgi:hypothetical protein